MQTAVETVFLVHFLKYRAFHHHFTAVVFLSALSGMPYKAEEQHF